MIPVVVFATTTRMITTTSFTAMMVVVVAITTMMMMTTTPTLAGPRRRRPGARPTGQSCRRSLGWATRGCPCGYGDPGQRCVRGCCPASTAGPVRAECRAGPYGYLGVGMGLRPLGSGGGPSASLPPRAGPGAADLFTQAVGGPLATDHPHRPAERKPSGFSHAGLSRASHAAYL